MDFHFEKDDAIKYGIEKAVLLYNLKFWIKKNKANGKNFIDGHYWTYNSCNSFVKLFPFWKIQKIGRLLRELEEDGVIKSSNYNTNRMDRSKWYCIIDESFMEDLEESSSASDCSDLNNDCSKMNNGTIKNEQCIYTDNKPYNKTHIKEKIKKEFEKPTAEQINSYCKEIGVSIDANYFIDFYEARGWLISGKTKMKDWKAAIRNWARRNGQTIKTKKQEQEKQEPIFKFEQKSLTEEEKKELESMLKR